MYSNHIKLGQLMWVWVCWKMWNSNTKKNDAPTENNSRGINRDSGQDYDFFFFNAEPIIQKNNIVLSTWKPLNTSLVWLWLHQNKQRISSVFLLMRNKWLQQDESKLNMKKGNIHERRMREFVPASLEGIASTIPQWEQTKSKSLFKNPLY